MKMHTHRPNADATLKRLQDVVKAEMEPPKFCKDCAWHDFESVLKRDEYIYRHYCKCPPILNVITGLPSNPAKNRNDEKSCGKSAKYFKKRS